MSNNSECEWIGPTDVADLVRVPVSTVYQWRHKGDGPRSIKVGRHVRYRRRDVEAWLEAKFDQQSQAS